MRRTFILIAGLALGMVAISCGDDKDDDDMMMEDCTPSFSAVEGIINASCAVAGCHNGSNPNLTAFTSKEVIEASAAAIKAQTSAGTMPPAGALPSESVDEIKCWADNL